MAALCPPVSQPTGSRDCLFLLVSSRLGQGLASAWSLRELDAHLFSRCVRLWGSVGCGEQLHGLGMKQGKGGKVLPQVPLENDFSVGSAVKLLSLRYQLHKL